MTGADTAMVKETSTQCILLEASGCVVDNNLEEDQYNIITSMMLEVEESAVDNVQDLYRHPINVDVEQLVVLGKVGAFRIMGSPIARRFLRIKLGLHYHKCPFDHASGNIYIYIYIIYLKAHHQYLHTNSFRVIFPYWMVEYTLRSRYGM